MFITSCKETVWLARSRNTSYFLHMVFYTLKARWLSWTTGKFQDFPGGVGTLVHTFTSLMESSTQSPGQYVHRGSPLTSPHWRALMASSLPEARTPWNARSILIMWLGDVQPNITFGILLRLLKHWLAVSTAAAVSHDSTRIIGCKVSKNIRWYE